MGRISPELVLVDPDLGELLRELLPEPGDCLAPRLRVSRSSFRSRSPSPSRCLVRSPRLLVDEAPLPYARRLAWVAVAALLASPLLAFVNVTALPARRSRTPWADHPRPRRPPRRRRPLWARSPWRPSPRRRSRRRSRRPSEGDARAEGEAGRASRPVRPTEDEAEPCPASPRKTRTSPSRPRAATKVKTRKQHAHRRRHPLAEAADGPLLQRHPRSAGRADRLPCADERGGVALRRRQVTCRVPLVRLSGFRFGPRACVRSARRGRDGSSRARLDPSFASGHRFSDADPCFWMRCTPGVGSVPESVGSRRDPNSGSAAGCSSRRPDDPWPYTRPP